MFEVRRVAEEAQSESAVEKRKSLVLVAETLDISFKRRRSRTLIVSVLVETFENFRQVSCLIDSDVEFNFVSQILIKNAQLKTDIVTDDLFVEAVNEHIMRFYEFHELSVQLRDSTKKNESMNIEFHVVNMRDYDMILDFSWLTIVESDIRWNSKFWTYRQSLSQKTKQIKISLCSAKKFVDMIMLVVIKKNHDHAYVAMSYQLLSMIKKYSLRRDEVVRCEALAVEDETHVSSQMRDIVKIFSKTLFDSLNTHKLMKHLIDF